MTARSKETDLQETWFDDQGTQLQVSCAGGECLGELSVLRPRYSEVTIEIFIQPRDDQGLPRGGLVAVHSERILLLPQFDPQRMSGHFWIPRGLSPETARECYYRITGVGEIEIPHGDEDT